MSSYTHKEDEYRIAADHLRYHIRMYVSTLLWLNRHPKPTGWQTEWNAILEDHLVHARLLINFLRPRRSSGPNKDRKTDVFAEDYFYDCHDFYQPFNDLDSIELASKVGRQMVHITNKSLNLKSDQVWETRSVARKLVVALKGFLSIVPEARLSTGAKSDALNFLDELPLSNLQVSISAST